ncbi:hypothetical protein, partial [Cupriavidus sp. CuC1]|uniref:hypothetical protein n=1 Tax=Cupriavidus sp. CuC1 TaxID=3373131 RepID=UPI0037CF4898
VFLSFVSTLFAAQRKVTGSPRRGMSYGSWVQKPTPFKQTPTNTARANGSALAPKNQHHINQ